LIKFFFVHYCLVENCYKSNLGVIIYKNTQRVHYPNFAFAN
jgi:hypothetical protein